MRTLSPPHSIVDAEDAARPGRACRGAVDFERRPLRLRPADGGARGLHPARPAGERVALVGRSGAGKTTAVSLLLRLYEVEGGAHPARRHRYPRPDPGRAAGPDRHGPAGDGDVQPLGATTTSATAGPTRPRPRSTRRRGAPRRTTSSWACATSRAATGYDAHLGERGVKLSGGQRQRIALARVILKNAPVLVLDEATSALDSEVEAAIQDTLDTVMEGKTVIAIAHRLSTIARMDRIVVLDDGPDRRGGHATPTSSPAAGSTRASGAVSPAASSTSPPNDAPCPPSPCREAGEVEGRKRGAARAACPPGVAGAMSRHSAAAPLPLTPTRLATPALEKAP